MKRKFSFERLYKLAKTVVIIATVVFLLLASLFTYHFYFLAEKQYEDCVVNTGSSYCLIHFESGDKMVDVWTLAILTPTVFFGGVKLFQYLFPRTEEEKNS